MGDPIDRLQAEYQEHLRALRTKVQELEDEVKRWRSRYDAADCESESLREKLLEAVNEIERLRG